MALGNDTSNSTNNSNVAIGLPWPPLPQLPPLRAATGRQDTEAEKTPTREFLRDTAGASCTQRAQYPLIKEYTLNQNIKAPIISGVFLNYGYWALWVGARVLSRPFRAVTRASTAQVQQDHHLTTMPTGRGQKPKDQKYE